MISYESVIRKKEKAKRFILENMRNGSVTVRSKISGKMYIVAKQYPCEDGWFLYEGCDLVVGDVTLDYVARVLLSETMGR